MMKSATATKRKGKGTWCFIDRPLSL